MAEAPPWGFHDLDPRTRWLAAYGLPTTLRPPNAPLDDHAWDVVRSECQRHRLAGLLIAAVRDGALPSTAEQRAEVASFELELTRRRGAYDERCRGPLTALADAGIEVRMLKGSALPWSDYPDPQLRPTSDLDLLVRSADLHRAVEVLVASKGRLVNPEPADGYATHVFKGFTVLLDTGMEVDLHRLLSWGSFGVRVPMDDLWTTGRTFDHLGVPAMTLDRPRTLLHLCGHLLLLGAVRASEARDVAQLLADPLLDVDEALEVAARWRQEAVLATAIRLAERDLALPSRTSPLLRWAAQHPVSPLDRLRLRIERPTSPVRGIEQVAVFASLPRGPGRGIQARAWLRPTPGTDPSPVDRLKRFARTSKRP